MRSVPYRMSRGVEPILRFKIIFYLGQGSKKDFWVPFMFPFRNKEVL